MRRCGGGVRVGCALAALVLCGGAALGPLSGVVGSVDLAQKQISVEIKKQGEKTFICDDKSSITFTGPILDGIKAGDRIMITLKPDTENVIAKAIVKRVGGGGGRGGDDQDKPAKRKKKRKKKDEDPPEGDDGDGDLVM
ncbi:MAG: hypothetical protein ACYTKD_29825 [Planctomycetota bacterium]